MPRTAGTGVLDLFESTGTFRQNQLILNVNSRLSSKVHVVRILRLWDLRTPDGDSDRAPSRARLGIPITSRADYGRAAFDIRHRVNINGTIVLPFGLRLSPNLTANSAPPFNITSGVDHLGDALFNARPAFVPREGFAGPACTTQLANAGVACIVSTPKLGNFRDQSDAGDDRNSSQLRHRLCAGERQHAHQPHVGLRRTPRPPRRTGIVAVAAGPPGGGGGPRRWGICRRRARPGGGGGGFFGGGDAGRARDTRSRSACTCEISSIP